MNTIGQTSFSKAWGEFNKLTEAEIINTPLDERIKLYKNLILCMPQDSNAIEEIAKDYKLIYKFIHQMPEECLDLDISRIFSTVNKGGLEKALHLAVAKNDYLSVERLIHAGVSVDTRDEEGDTPLLLAALNGQDDIVQLLIDNGSDIDQINSNGDTPLSLAAFGGHSKIFKLFLDKGSFINQGNQNGDTALSLAASKGHTHIVKLLLEKNTPIDGVNDEGNTPLLLAVMHGHEDMVKLLLENGSSIHQTDHDGDTPLLLAIQLGHHKIVELLLENGSSILETDRDGDSPLSLAVVWGHHNIVELLLEKGAEINEVNYKGKTALSLAAENEHTNIVQLLLKRGAEIEHFKEADRSFVYQAKMKQLMPSEDLRKISKGADAVYNLMKQVAYSKAVGHSLKFSHEFEVNADPLQSLPKISTEYGEGPYFFRRMFKATQLMMSKYPELMPAEKSLLLCKSLSEASNQFLESPDELFKKYKNGELLMLPVGFEASEGDEAHYVVGMLLESTFILCNRGDLSRKPIEVYTFDSSKLDVEMLTQMVNLRKTEEEYEDLFFNHLPSQLNFDQGPLQKEIENACKLAMQKVGNCTWESPETTVWAFMQPWEIQRPEEEVLQDTSSLPEEYEEKSKAAQQFFVNWLLFNQLYNLERYIGIRQLRGSESVKEDKIHYTYPLSFEMMEKALNELTLAGAGATDIDPKIQVEFDKMKQTLELLLNTAATGQSILRGNGLPDVT